MDDNYSRDEYGNRTENRVIKNVASSESGVVSTKEWIITLLILMIPLVNIVMVFVWAFGGGSNPSKANYFKASLIVGAIGIVLWFLFVGAMLMPFISSSY